MGTRSKKLQPAASGAAATSDVDDSTEADANGSTEFEVVSEPLGQSVTIEQISLLLQTMLQASQAALKADLQASQAALKAELKADLTAELQASQAAFKAEL